VADSGGRVFFQVPADRVLGIGRHRVRFVVAGDLTATEAFVEVVPPGTRVFVSDVDGTLTTDENAEFVGLLSGTLPDANPDAASVLTLLAGMGYRPWYLTARPEWLVERTREFLAERGFPPGILHTTLSATGASGADAAAFKTEELELQAQKGLTPVYAFGNTDSDAQAYAAGGVAPDGQRIFYQFSDDAFGGRRIEAYAELQNEFEAAEPVCR
jgi:phosphatidate phosphatase PAH1